MIDHVDSSLGELIRAEALDGWDAEIMYDAPDREWAARRTRPVVDVFLYDIRQDEQRREVDSGAIRNELGRVIGHARPIRYFTLSYIVTTWARRPEDEHRLLAQVILALLRYDRIPADYLQGPLTELAQPLTLSLSKLGSDRSVAEIWSVMGGQLHPSVDLNLSVPFDPALRFAAGPLVTEQPDLIARRLPGVPPTDVPVPSPFRARPRAAPPGMGSPTRGHITE